MQGIILINRSFAKQINLTEIRRKQKQADSKAKTFPVPFGLGEIIGNITITTNTPSNPSQEEIINQAIQFHSKGNISEAIKYYLLDET